MESVKCKVQEAFDKCQERRYNLTKLAEILKKFYIELSDDRVLKDEFHSQFLYHVECLLQDPGRDVATERCIQFIARFTAHFADTSDENDGNVDDDLFSFLIKFMLQSENNCHSNKTIRFRICQLVHLLVSEVPNDAALDEDLMDSMTMAMLDRIQDKLPMIRCQAARTLSRLQQPSLHECPVIEAYLFHAACDDSSQVRSAVLSNISLTTKTLPCVLDRTRDVSENVRKVAYQVIAQKVSIKALTSSQRLYLIKQGLMDSSEIVRDVVQKQLFQAWLLTYQASLIDLLKKLDVIGAHETCCKAVISMFECSSLSDLIEGFALLDERKLIDFNKLTPESAMYWCQLCEYMRLKGIDGEKYIDKLLPSTLTFSEYIKEYITKMVIPFMEDVELSAEKEDDKIEKEFITEQLIKIAIKMDLSDNAGRKQMNETFCEAITNIDVVCFPCLIAPLASGLLDLISANLSVEREEDDKVDMIASMISTIREPHHHLPEVVFVSEEEMRNCKLKIAKTCVVINEASVELERCVACKNFEGAADLQSKIDCAKDERKKLEELLQPHPDTVEDARPVVEKSDVGTIIKCLKILKELFSSLFESRCKPSRSRKYITKGIHPTMLQLLETLVIPSVLNSSPDVRREAIRCIGVGCMFSTSLSARHFTLLIQVAQADTYIVRVAAINAINDLIRMFGVKVLVASRAKKSSSTGNVEEELINNEYDDADVGSVIVRKFMDMLDDEEVEIRRAASCLLCRVLVSHRVLSPGVVSRLILLWYNPATRDEPCVLHSISNFLNIFPYMSKVAHECIEASFLPIMRVLFNAPSSSPYASVNINNVAELLVSITKPSIINKASLRGICDEPDKRWLRDWSAHDDFAVMLSNEVLSDPMSPYVNNLCKILPILELNPNLVENLKDISVLCDNMLKAVKDKQAIRSIRKFQTQVTSLNKQTKVVPNIEVTSDDTKENNCVEKSGSNVVGGKSTALQPISPSSGQNITATRQIPTKELCVLLGNSKRNLSQLLVDGND